MGLFDKRQSFSKRELGSMFSGEGNKVSKIGGRRTSRIDREKIFRETFGKELDISKEDYKKAISKLDREQRGTTDSWKRRTINERIKFLKEFEKK
jgi:acyl-CoA reductase-like NAD-dependent aldehyde dehydrogenase